MNAADTDELSAGGIAVQGETITFSIRRNTKL